MLNHSMSSPMAAAFLQQARQQQQSAVAAVALMAGTINNSSTTNNSNNNNNNHPPVLPRDLEEEVGRRKAVMAGTPYSVSKQFPWRLHKMLELVEKEGLEEIVSFLPDGRSFKVHDPSRFEKGLMRRCFNQTRYKSFQRQLNLWGFERKNDPVFKIKGTYSHPWFIRGRDDLTPLIVRVGGAGSKFKTNLDSNNTAEAPTTQQVASNQTLQGENNGGKSDTMDDVADAAESLTLIHQTGSPTSALPTVLPERATSKNDQMGEANSTHSQAVMLPGKANIASLYGSLLKKDASFTSSSASSLLNTIHSHPNFALPGRSSSSFKSSDDDDSNPLFSVISALNRAEAIGCLTSNRGMDVSRNSATATPTVPTPGTSDDLLQQLQNRRASAIARKALIEEAMKIASQRNATSNGANDDSYMEFLQAKMQNQMSSATTTAASLSNQTFLQQLFGQKQQEQDPQAVTEASIREIANQRVAQLIAGNSNSFSVQNNAWEKSSGVNNQGLQRLLDESGNFSNTGWIGLPRSSLNAVNNNSNNNATAAPNNILLEKLRLEEGIQTLMRERVRLEAAAILEERERRRLEYLAAMQL